MLDEGPARDIGVVVSKGRFVDIGALDALTKRHPQLTALALPQRLLMPGFIDAHHHLTQSFGKALAFGEPSEIYRRIWVPLESELDEQALYLSSKLAALEALRGGFTTVCDAGTRAKAGARRGGRCGARRRPALRARARVQRRRRFVERGRRRCAGQRSAISQAALPIRWCIRRSRYRFPKPRATRCSASSRGCAGSRRAVPGARQRTPGFGGALTGRARACGRSSTLHRASALGPQTLVAHATLVTPHRIAAAARHRHRGQLQPGRKRVERQRRGADARHGGAGHPLRSRHRRHAQRWLSSDGRGRDGAAPRFRPANRRLVVRRRLDVARPCNRRRRACSGPGASAPGASRPASPPTSCSSTSTCPR